MNKKYFDFLDQTNYAMLFTSAAQAKEYCNASMMAINAINDAINGKANVFLSELHSLLQKQLDNHLTDVPYGTKLWHGEFRYLCDNLDERISDADKRCAPKGYKAKFYTVSTINIAQTYDYQKTKSHLIAEDVKVFKPFQLVDLRGEAKENETLFVAIKAAVEQLAYNSIIPNTNVGFIMKLIEELGYAGVVYKSAVTNENVYIIFNPQKTVCSLLRRIVLPADYNSFFEANK